MNSLNNITVIIPSLDPDEKLSKVVEGVRAQGFSDIVIVDDGSKDENKKFFPQSEDITLLVHEVNLGKGAALKTAINYVINNRQHSQGVVTCDGDGQHLAEDIMKVCQTMLESGKFVLGVRDFSLSNVPFKSRLGNRLSSLALAVCCGSYISDTQTGLRAIPSAYLENMAQVEGARFEYETNVLLGMKSMGVQYCEDKIRTVYIDENKGTHFHPIKDTVKIFSLIIKYLFSSIAAFLTDIILFYLLNSVISCGVLVSTVVARIFSSAVNFFLNKNLVFKSKGSLFKPLLKYYGLAVLVMLVSAFSVKGISALLNLAGDSWIVTLIKVAVDFVLFIVNFKIQKEWIFKQR